MDFITRILRDTTNITSDILTEETAQGRVRVLAAGKRNASALLCRLVEDPESSPQAARSYQKFLSELRAS